MSIQAGVSMCSSSVALQTSTTQKTPLASGLGSGLGLGFSSTSLLSTESKSAAVFSSNYVSEPSFRSRSKSFRKLDKKNLATIKCAASKGGGTQRTAEQINSDARIRSEVTAPFRTVRMALSLACMASGGLGALIALTRVVGALGGAPNAAPLVDTLQGLAIDIGAVLGFALLYRSDKKAEQKSIARITREETLSGLRIELSNKRIVTVGQMRGICRLVIMAGSQEHIEESFRQAEKVKTELLERGVLLVPFYRRETGKQKTETETETETVTETRKAMTIGEEDKKFIATPIYTNEWAKWLKEQMALANVSDDKPVYISLRLDGRVRGSGVGFPPFKALSLQLPPQKGIWAGPLDGMDGRV